MNTTNFNNYLSSQIYKTLVPSNHFLKRLDEIIDWHDLIDDLKTLAKNTHGGRPRYNPVLLFKMLFLSFLFNLSDRNTSEFSTNNIPAKFFLGLPITEEAPDFTTLSIFRNEILKSLGIKWFEETFRNIIIRAKEAGVEFGTIHSLDATHTLADVDTRKDKERKDKGLPQRDKDSSWGAKGTETKLTPQGEKVTTIKFFKGYKAHLVSETNNGIITSLDVSSGNVSDIDAGEELIVNKLNEQEKKDIGILTADKGYGGGVFIGILEKDYGIQTAFCLSKQFLRGRYRNRWKNYLLDKTKTKARKKRYVIERVNADLKNNHGLRKCRYLGLKKYHLQTIMSAMAHNLKTIIAILTGARLRPI